METNTITQIAALRDSIAENIEVYRKNQRELGADMNVGQFGSESEYSIIGLVGGVKNILTDISYLVKAHNIFIKLSTYSERNTIINQLAKLDVNLQNSNHTQIAIYLDQLKVSLRCYNLRSDKDRLIEFSDEIDNLRKTALSLESVIAEVKDKITDSESVYEEIIFTKEKYDEVLQNLDSQKDALTEAVEAFIEKFEDFKSLATAAEENEKIISEKLEEVKESEEAFDEFISKIDEREKQLGNQKAQTTKYINDLSRYTEEHNQKLKEAQDLIDKALIALQYSTAEGISAAFQSQHDKANNKKEHTLWLLAAGVFILITIGLGVWIVCGWGINSDEGSPVLLDALV